MNEVEVTVRGNVSSAVDQRTFPDGNVLTSFRLATNVRRWDSDAKDYVTQHTMWLTVNCRRALGANVMESVVKGQPVVVHGRLKQQKWAKEERSGEAMSIDADVVGVDLNFGTTRFSKVSRVERRIDNAELGDATADLVLAEQAEAAGPAPWEVEEPRPMVPA